MKKTWFILGGAIIIVGTFISIGWLKSSIFKNVLPQIQKPTVTSSPERFSLQSPSFASGETIPEKYTCDGINMRPPIVMNGVPDGTMSLAVVMYDPDAPGGSFVHWLAWNIPPETKELPEGNLSGIIKEGKTSFGNVGYMGPCPPSGTHRYVWRLYALRNVLALDREASRDDLETAMNTHVISQAEFMGRYTKK